MTVKRSMRPRRPVHRAALRRRKSLGWRARLIFLALAVFVVLLAVGVIARQVAPTSNTSLTRFDVLIVLGSPADDDGNPTPEQLAHITEGVHEYERGVAPRLILTGGAAHTPFAEARVMARTAQALGIPASAIFIEPESMNTIQNARYSMRIMQTHGWHSAEVISAARHLPRAGYIFDRLPLEWRTHAAPMLTPQSTAYSSALTASEILKTARYFVWTRWMERYEP